MRDSEGTVELKGRLDAGCFAARRKNCGTVPRPVLQASYEKDETWRNWWEGLRGTEEAEIGEAQKNGLDVEDTVPQQSRAIQMQNAKDVEIEKRGQFVLYQPESYSRNHNGRTYLQDGKELQRLEMPDGRVLDRIVCWEGEDDVEILKTKELMRLLNKDDVVNSSNATPEQLANTWASADVATMHSIDLSKVTAAPLPGLQRSGSSSDVQTPLANRGRPTPMSASPAISEGSPAPAAMSVFSPSTSNQQAQRPPQDSGADDTGMSSLVRASALPQPAQGSANVQSKAVPKAAEKKKARKSLTVDELDLEMQKMENKYERFADCVASGTFTEDTAKEFKKECGELMTPLNKAGHSRTRDVVKIRDYLEVAERAKNLLKLWKNL